MYCNEVITTTVQCNLIAGEEHCETVKECFEAVSLDERNRNVASCVEGSCRNDINFVQMGVSF